MSWIPEIVSTIQLHMTISRTMSKDKPIMSKYDDDSMDEAAQETEADDFDLNNFELDEPEITSLPGQLMVEKIEIENFKSYAGKKTIGPFHKGFTCVVGANGSGKSNLIDAMLFVFGYRAQRIRGQKLSTLIHDSSSQSGSNSCSVTICFQRIENIVSHPDDYNVIQNSKFTVTRTAHKSGISSYMIDGREVRFAQVKELLRKHGVDVDSSRFLILQGEVEHISIMKPKAQKENETGLLEFLEELIGTKRYEGALQRLVDESEKLGNVKIEKHNRVRIAEQECNELKGRRDKAIEYLEFENEIIRDRHAVANSRLKQSELKAEEAKEKYDLAAQELQELEVGLCSLEAERESKKKILIDTKRHLTTNEEQVENLKARLTEFEKNSIANKKSLEHNKKMLKSLSSDITEDRKQIEELERRIHCDPDKIKLLRQEAEEKKMQVDKVEGELSQAEKALWESTKHLRDRISNLQKEQLKMVDECNNAKTLYDIAVSNKQTALSDKAKLEKELADTDNIVQTLRKILPELSRELYAGENKLKQSLSEENEAQSRIQELLQKENHMREQLRKHQVELNEYMEYRAKLKNRSKVLDFLFSCVDSGQISGVYGRLGDLGFIDERYDIAASTAGGRYLDFIVVDTMDTAQKCVELLKSHNIGFASFLGLDKQQKWHNHITRKINAPEGVPRIFDLINVSEDVVKPAFYFAYRDTLIAKDLNQATRVAYGSVRYRVVTMAGQLIEISGTLSGGGNPIKGRIGSGKNIRKSLNHDFGDVDSLKSLCSKLEGEYQELRGQIEDVKRNHFYRREESARLQTEIDKTRQKIEETETSVKVNQSKLDRLQIKYEHINIDDAELEKMTSDIESKRIAYEKVSQVYNEIDSKVESVKSQITEETDRQLGEIRKNLSCHRSLLKEVTLQINQIQNELKTSNRNLAKINDRLQKNMQKSREVEQTIGTLEKNIEQMVMDNEQLKEKYEEAQHKVTEIRGRCSTLSAEVKEISNRIMDSQRGNIDIREKVSRLARELQEYRALCDSFIKQLKSLKLNEIYEGYNLKPLDLNQCISEIEANKLVKSIEERQRKIDQMKPDIKAIEDYDIKRKAFEMRKQELDEVYNKIHKVREKYDILRKRRETEFMGAFEIIAKGVKAIYRELTYGGDADLELVDSLDPFAEGIEFSVRPPEKSWKKISNVSGGEKTLSSLALIFALHEYKPAPLYFMDEVDAALDYKNVSIVADFIKERSRSAQFVVISLRLDMQESADYLCGVFKQNNMSFTVTVNPRLLILKGEQLAKDMQTQENETHAKSSSTL